MSKVYGAGVLIAFLVACLSAPGTAYTLRLNAEDTSPKIGNTVFLMEVPYVEDMYVNKTGNGATAGYNYTSISMQFWKNDGSMAVYAELLYFPMGLPPYEEACRTFISDFEKKTGGKVFRVNESYDQFSGYQAKVWDVRNPINDRPGFIAKAEIDSQRVFNIIADPNTFGNSSLKIGVVDENKVVWL
jgi:hypothetical protein